MVMGRLEASVLGQSTVKLSKWRTEEKRDHLVTGARAKVLWGDAILRIDAILRVATAVSETGVLGVTFVQVYASQAHRDFPIQWVLCYGGVGTGVRQISFMLASFGRPAPVSTCPN